ncbi:MAG TPA: phosphotransferase [Chloroflexia bacterium]|nr:phosphotransferase [Chloroflexia bacterium]
MLEDGATARGSVTTIQRVGDTIRRPMGRWTPVVHALLRHLEAVGFTGAPRVLGVDEQGREILSFLRGSAAMRPWPAILREEQGLVSLGRWLRDYHEAVRGFVPASNADWYVPDLHWQPGQIVRHGDLGPWNTIWLEDRLVGVIDWDFAEPGESIDDIAQVAWYAVPLRPEEQCRMAGFEQAPDLQARLWALCDTCGVTPAAVLDALANLQVTELRRTTYLGQRGVAPWAGFLERGDQQEISAENLWLIEHRAQLLG